MNDYAELYYKLFNKITDVIHELQLVQQQVEDAYISLQPDQVSLPASGVPLKTLPVGAISSSTLPTNVLSLRAYHMENDSAMLPESQSAKPCG